jgi:hypothetical protein
MYMYVQNISHCPIYLEYLFIKLITFCYKSSLILTCQVNGEKYKMGII